jgi:nucleoside-diphosphate-sugar epimerase
MEKILVTGGAGYIGSILVPDLLSDGHEVTVLDNFLYRQNSLASSFIDPNFRVVVGDIRDTALMQEEIKNHDVIIPLAAIVGAPACNRDAIAAESTNLIAAKQIIDLTSSSQLIVMPTTNSAYGTTPTGTVSTEESPLNPISSYAKHKVEVENHLMGKGNAVSFRLATVFGMSPRMRLDLLVNDMVYRALNDRSVVLFEADFIRNYVHVKDVSRGIRWAIKQAARNEIYNFGLSDANLSKIELCEYIKKYLPNFTFFKAEFGSDPDQRNYTVSNAKVESAGFKFHYKIQDGIIELIAGLKTLKNGVYSNV